MAVRLKKESGDRYVLDLEALEPGDLVAMVTAHNWRREMEVTVYTVTKLTKTQVVVTGRGGRETRFRREDGSEVGQSHWDRLAAMFAPEVLNGLEAERMRKFWRDADEIIKRKPTDHDARGMVLSDLEDLSTQARKDLVEIRAAQHEWSAEVARAGA